MYFSFINDGKHEKTRKCWNDSGRRVWALELAINSLLTQHFNFSRNKKIKNNHKTGIRFRLLVKFDPVFKHYRTRCWKLLKWPVIYSVESSATVIVMHSKWSLLSPVAWSKRFNFANFNLFIRNGAYDSFPTLQQKCLEEKIKQGWQLHGRVVLDTGWKNSGKSDLR